LKTSDIHTPFQTSYSHLTFARFALAATLTPKKYLQKVYIGGEKKLFISITTNKKK